MHHANPDIGHRQHPADRRRRRHSCFACAGTQPCRSFDGGTLSFTLAGPIEEADALIVVDAANIKAAAGEWRLFQGQEMDAFLMGNRKSTVHEVGLTDLRAIAILAGHWPEKRAMLAIQPEIVDWGEQPTPAVAAAISPVCVAIHELLQAWDHAA